MFRKGSWNHWTQRLKFWVFGNSCQQWWTSFPRVALPMITPFSAPFFSSLFLRPVNKLCPRPKLHENHHFGELIFGLAPNFLKVEVKVTQSCLTLCDPIDCSRPGSSVHGILQATILVWVPFPSPGDHPDSGIEPRCLALEVDSLPSESPGKRLNKAMFHVKLKHCTVFLKHVKSWTPHYCICRGSSEQWLGQQVYLTPRQQWALGTQEAELSPVVLPTRGRSKGKGRPTAC